MLCKDRADVQSQGPLGMFMLILVDPNMNSKVVNRCKTISRLNVVMIQG